MTHWKGLQFNLFRIDRCPRAVPESVPEGISGLIFGKRRASSKGAADVYDMELLYKELTVGAFGVARAGHDDG